MPRDGGAVRTRSRWIQSIAMVNLVGLVLAVASATPWGTGASRGEDLAVTLVTFGPGDDLTEWFGHSALIVEDTKLHVARIYNYGEFDFDATTIPRYVLGELTFHVGEDDVERTLALYRARNRSILLQELALSPEQKLGVAHFLDDNIKPANRNYQYDHYLDNCATKPRDIIDRFSDHALSSRAQPGRMTLRGHTRRYVRGVLGVLIDFAENGSIDQPITTWQEAFLPAELAEQVRAAGLAAKETQWFTAKRDPIPSQPPPLWPAMLALGVVVGGAGVVAGIARRRRLVALHAMATAVLLGVPGTLAALLWIVTTHQVAHENENLFSSSPLTLACGVIAIGLFSSTKHARAHRMLAIAWPALALLAIVASLASAAGVLGQDVLQWSALAVPLLVGAAIAFRFRAEPR
jgi:hypothetical protein